MIAALYIAKNGSYVNLAGVDAWHETRDARLYAGPHPVVAHPPCQRWGKLWAGQPLHIKRTGQRKIKGDDGGCFEAALSAVRSYGGVLEHPCDSHAWAHFGLNKPPRTGGSAGSRQTSMADGRAASSRGDTATTHANRRGFMCSASSGPNSTGERAYRGLILPLSPAWGSSERSGSVKPVTTNPEPS